MKVVIARKANALVVKTPEIDRLATLIPTAKRIRHEGQLLLAMKHTIEATKILRNEGALVPSPIAYQYQWSGRYTPFAAQQETAAFLTLHRRAFVLNDIGTGKSLAALWAYDYLRQQGALGKLLIVSPLSTLERTWGDEIFRHFPKYHAVVLHGSRERRFKLLDIDADIYIVNHDGVKILVDAFKDRPDIDHVIVDEIAQCARNSGTDRWKVLNEVVNKQSMRGAWGLTGTPTPNLPTDAWAQARLLVPSTVPPYFGRFRDQVMRQVGPYGWIPKEGHEEVVFDTLQPSIRFSRDECVDLPPCLYETREVPLTPAQAKAYKSMMNTLMVEAASGDIIAVNEAVKMAKLLQIVCGVAYNRNGDEVTIDVKPRLNAVVEAVENTGSKVIVFVPFVSAVRLVSEHLTANKISNEMIYGGVSKNDRDRIFSDFQRDPTLRVLVAQPAAMSHGLTLTEASTVVWYAPITSNDIFEQANGRITRPGQKNTQFIIMLEGASVERRIYTRLQNKQKLQGVLLDMVKESRK